MLKSLAFLLLLLVPAQCLHSIQVRQGQEPKAQENPTLRDWLNQDKFHLSMAPLWHDSMHIHMAILNVLKKNGLDQNVASMSGSSVASLVAAMWASNPGEKKYGRVLGSTLKSSDCEPNCDKFQKFYLNFLDAPLDHEMFAQNSVMTQQEMMATGMRSWDMTRMTPPSRRESYTSWLRYMFYMDLVGVKRSFEETTIPIAISGFHKAGADSKTVLMSKGNLHLAVLAGLGPPGSTERVAVSDEYSTVDGYMGDEHGARGYDALEPEQRPARMLNLVCAEDPADWRTKILDFSRLSKVKELKEAVSIIMAHRMSQDIMTKIHKGEAKNIKGRDLVMATHKAWAKALDLPLMAAEPHQRHKVVSYYQTMDFIKFFPKGFPHTEAQFSGNAKDMQFIDGSTHFKDRHLGVEWHPEMYPASKAVEVVDKGHVLEDPTLHRLHKRLKHAFIEMFSGDRFLNYTETTDSKKLPELMVMDGEAMLTTFQALNPMFNQSFAPAR